MKYNKYWCTWFCVRRELVDDKFPAEISEIQIWKKINRMIVTCMTLLSIYKNNEIWPYGFWKRKIYFVKSKCLTFDLWYDLDIQRILVTCPCSMVQISARSLQWSKQKLTLIQWQNKLQEYSNKLHPFLQVLTAQNASYLNFFSRE